MNFSEPSTENTADYHSTGPYPVTLTSTEKWERFDLGRLAQAVLIDATDAVQVAYANPHVNQSNVWPLSKEDSPFLFGSGEMPLETAFVWVRKAPSASVNPDVKVMAL